MCNMLGVWCVPCWGCGAYHVGGVSCWGVGVSCWGCGVYHVGV